MVRDNSVTSAGSYGHKHNLDSSANGLLCASKPAAGAAQCPPAAAPKPSTAFVAAEFVSRYYELVEKHPKYFSKLYKEESQFALIMFSGSTEHTKTTVTTTAEQVAAIAGAKTEVISTEAQSSMHHGVMLHITGIMTLKDAKHHFSQTFFLAPQAQGFYVLNDVLTIQAPEAPAHAPLENSYAVPRALNAIQTAPAAPAAAAVNTGAGEEVVQPSTPPQTPAAPAVPQGPTSYADRVRMHGSTPSSSPSAASAASKAIASSSAPAFNHTTSAASGASEAGRIHDASQEANGIFLRGLSPATTKDKIADFASKFGPISSINIVRNRGFDTLSAYVDFKLMGSAQAALAQHSGRKMVIGGYQVSVLAKIPRAQRIAAASQAAAPRGGRGGADLRCTGSGTFGGGRAGYPDGGYNSRAWVMLRGDHTTAGALGRDVAQM